MAVVLILLLYLGRGFVCKVHMEKKEKKTESPHHRHPLFQMTSRILVFFSLFVVVSLVFYITGNINRFLDTSLLLILHVIQVASTVTLVLCVFSLVQVIVFSIYYKDLLYLWHLLYILFASLVSAVGFVLSGVVGVLSAGM